MFRYTALSGVCFGLSISQGPVWDYVLLYPLWLGLRGDMLPRIKCPHGTLGIDFEGYLAPNSLLPHCLKYMKSISICHSVAVDSIVNTNDDDNA